jgi:hypothetical protein
MNAVKTYKKALAVLAEHDTLTARLHGLDTMLLQNILLGADNVYVPEYFRTPELVPRSVYERWGAGALMFMDVRMLWTADAIREYFAKPMMVNFREFQYRGFRPPNYVGGAELSQHRFGRALDFDIKGVAAPEVRQEILDHPSEPSFRYITVLEDAVSWVHADCRLTNKSGIQLINP